MRKSAFLVLITSILLFSCAREESDNVNQDSIYSIYELHYNTDTDITKAKTTFRFGGPTGTLLELTSPAEITFENDELLYQAGTGIHKKEYAGFTSSGTYVYTDLDNNVFTNTTPIIDTLTFPTIDTISTSGAYTFAWEGNPVSAGETITLTIDGPQQSNFEVFSTSTVGATEIILSQSKLQNLGLGDATCVLVRAYNSPTVTEGTSTGGRVAIWYTTSGTTVIGE